MSGHFLEIIAQKQTAERPQPQAGRVGRTCKLRSKEMAEDLLADVSRAFLLPRSTALSETHCEILQTLINNCEENVFRIARLEGHLNGGGFPEAVHRGFELTRLFGQKTGMEKGTDKGTPRLAVLWVSRQTSSKVRGRLIQQVQGFVGFTGNHQRQADPQFEDACPLRLPRRFHHALCLRASSARTSGTSSVGMAMSVMSSASRAASMSANSSSSVWFS